MSTPTRTPIVVNSSPILGLTTKIPHLSSSPGLPSLNDVRGSQNSAMAGPSYDAVPTSITIISALRPTTELEDSVIKLPSPASAAPLPLSTTESAVQKKRKPRVKKLDEHGNPIPPKLRTKKLGENGDPILPKPRSKKLDENGDPIPAKPRARKLDADGNLIPPKLRAKEVDESGNSIPPKPQAPQKPKIGTDTSGIAGYWSEASATSAKPTRTAPSACKKKTTAISVYFDTSKDKEKPVKLLGLDKAPLNLEPAIPRRKPWTPPPADTVERDSSSQFRGEPLGTLLVKRRQKAKEIFKTLESNFGYQETENSRPSPQNEGPVLRKRRRVSFTTKEKDKEPDITPAVVLGAVKAPRRKVTTLTEAVLDQFDNNRVDLTYLSGYQNPDLVEKEKDHIDFGSMKVKKKKRKEKLIDPDLILLSPGTAMKQADDQEFVFGTSSQLVREESPTFLRDLQAAIEASRQTHQKEQLGSWMDGGVEGEPKRSNRLWRQASRNDDGGFIDLCDDDSFNMDMEDMLVKPKSPVIEEDPLPLPAKDTEILPDANAILPRTPCKPKPSVATQTPSKLNQNLIPHFSLPSSPPRLPIRSSPIRKTVEVQTAPLPAPESVIPDSDFDMPNFDPSPKEKLITLKPPAKTPVKLPIVSSPPKTFLDMSPKLSLMSTTQLASRMSSFGFKAMNSRSKMIALLQTCYASRSTTAPTASFAVPRAFESPLGTTSNSPASASHNDDSVSSIPAKRSRSRRSSTTSRTGESADESSTSSSNNPPSTKRWCGRPQKNPVAEIVVTTTTRQSPKKSTSSRKSPVRKSPMRKSSTKRTQSGNPPYSSHPITIEVPDSDDDELELPKSPIRPKSPVLRKSKSSVREPSPVLDPDSSFSDNGYLEVAHNGDETHVGDVSLAVDPTAEKRIMFNSISEAIQTAPRTRDPANPSWFDRILLYDPIAFEDLTEWLNRGQLERVGYDFEVAPGDVKAWCEAKSVCCVKRETRKGKERKRL